MNKLNLFLKRSIDIFGSLFGLVFLFPFFIVISILIKSTSNGPILFKQERIGRKGKTFNIFKFRTMVLNAEKIGDGLSVKSDTDNRITKIGRFLRSTSLDELPQLFNVLFGQMSLVGPRPPVTYYPYHNFEGYPLWAKNRFKMKPGITGLTQITVRNSVTWDERIKIDNIYIAKFNVFLDLKIILQTFIRIIFPKNMFGENFSSDRKSKKIQEGDSNEN